MANVRRPNDIILGSGRMFINGEDVGQLKEDVTFEHEKTMYELKAGFPAAVVLTALTGESLKSEFQLLETNLDVICRLMPEYLPITETGGTATVENEVVAVFSVKHSMLANDKLEPTVAVTTTEGSSLVEGTDYYLDRLRGAIYRVPASTLLNDGDSVKVSYTHKTFEASGFGIGGGASTDVTFQVDFYHKRRDGRYRRIRIWKAKVDGNFIMAFKEAAESPLSVTVTALADSSKPAGQQFLTTMDIPAQAVPDGGW